MTHPLIAEIEGYASIFNEADLNGDIIMPGAFAKSLKKNRKPALLYQHAAEAPIGRWLSFREDARGLFVKGELILSSARAREVHALLEGGAIDGLSIGYQTARAVRTKTGRRITEADLWEVSVVTFPMASRARVTRIEANEVELSRGNARQVLKLNTAATPAGAIEPVPTAPPNPASGAPPTGCGAPCHCEPSQYRCVPGGSPCA